jgi:hypothetical protein
MEEFFVMSLLAENGGKIGINIPAQSTTVRVPLTHSTTHSLAYCHTHCCTYYHTHYHTHSCHYHIFINVFTAYKPHSLTHSTTHLRYSSSSPLASTLLRKYSTACECCTSRLHCEWVRSICCTGYSPTAALTRTRTRTRTTVPSVRVCSHWGVWSLSVSSVWHSTQSGWVCEWDSVRECVSVWVHECISAWTCSSVIRYVLKIASIFTLVTCRYS